MNYYGIQYPGYGYNEGIPPAGNYQQMDYGYGQPPRMPPTGFAPPQGGYGMPVQGFGGFNPMPYCHKCGGTGYRMKKGKNKRCKCIKEQAKRMGRRYDFSSSDSD